MLSAKRESLSTNLRKPEDNFDNGSKLGTDKSKQLNDKNFLNLRRPSFAGKGALRRGSVAINLGNNKKSPLLTLAIISSMGRFSKKFARRGSVSR